MEFKIDAKIFEQHPDLVVAVVVAHNSNNAITNPELEKLLIDEQERIKKRFTNGINEDPRIVSWQTAYKKFGAKPKEHLSSIENLIKRILKGQSVRSINPLVDIYNIISLHYLIPAGGEDLDTINGNIELTYAGAQEKPILLLGEKEERAPQPGEIIYKDDNGAICRRWNWKEAERTKITNKTENAFLVLEALSPVTKDVVEHAAHSLANLIEHFCGGTASVALLDVHHRSIVLKTTAGFKAFEPKKSEAELMPLRIEDQIIVHEGEGTPLEHEIRIEKVKQLREKGIEPWPENKPVPNTCHEVIEQFKPDQEKEYTIAGRLMSKRLHGKTAFCHIQDRTGTTQVYIRKDAIGEEQFNLFEHFIDIGDIILAHGFSFITKTNEITLKVQTFELLSKCLYPLPEKYHGLTHVETRYRQRYLDLMTNPESKDKFIKRTKMIREIRTFLNGNDFIEVETPMLHPIAGGAAARPFITHHNALDSDFYLRIAPELYLKRLVIGGFERVYEINRNFRNEGISTRHNPEFTMLEFYMAYQDYHYIMGFVEQLMRKVLFETVGALELPFGSDAIDFAASFRRLSIKDAVKEYMGLTDNDLKPESIDAVLKKHEVKPAHTQATVAEKMYALFEECVEKQLRQPTFIIDFPIEVSPLAKRDAHNSTIAARFELFIAGMEIANGFNELNDPFDQAERFKEQLKAHKAGNEEAHQYDADYIKALEYGLAPTVGVGIGIDRFAMLMTNTTSIKDVILFPTLKKV